MPNDLVFISDVIYSLKQEYGKSIRLGKIISSVPNILTGIKTNQISEIKIPRAIQLPNQISLEFIRSIGGQRGLEAITGTIRLLIDKKDIPSTFIVSNINSYAIIDNRKFDILKIDDFEHALIVYVKTISGQLPPSNDLSNQNIIVNSGVGGEID